MADTDVYRVLLRWPEGTWDVVTSNRHPHGLHTELKNAKASISQHKGRRYGRPGYMSGCEFKIQKLVSVGLYSDNWATASRLEWVDVDV